MKIFSNVFKNDVNHIGASSPIKSAQMHAVVIRADGTRENLGIVSYYHRNPLKRLAFWLKSKVKKLGV